MHCKNPYTQGGMAFGCGQCLPCRINRRRIWTHRIILEAALRKDNAFVTLTYDDDNLPDPPEVNPKDLSGFMKRLRRNTKLKLRFYGVGEYGDETFRPHYHIALFGYPRCLFATTRHHMRYCCSACEAVRVAWGKGRIEVAGLDPESAAYTAGYVVKKLTDWHNPLLEGRHPEFARMSNRPGIGADAMDEVASDLLTHGLEKTLEDVPSTLAHGKRAWPLGRYLKRRLRERIGRDKNAPKSVVEKIEKELQPLRESAYNNAVPGFKNFAFKQAIIEKGEQKRRNIEARDKIHRSRKKRI